MTSLKNKHNHYSQGKTAELVLLLLFLLCATSPTLAQNRAQRSSAIHPIYQENFMVSLVPVPLFFNGFRVDFDARIKDNLWINIAPQYNYQRKPSLHATQNGFCLEVNFRYFEPRAKGLYYAAGVGIEYNQASRLNSKGQYFEVHTTRLGSQVQLGYLVKMWSRAMFDIYIGAAYRYAFNQFPSEPYAKNFRIDPTKPWSYQFSGVFMEAGIRIGFML